MKRGKLVVPPVRYGVRYGGERKIDYDNIRFEEDPKGNLLLWKEPKGNGDLELQHGEIRPGCFFVIGVSCANEEIRELNYCAEILDCNSSERIAEYYVNVGDITASEFAEEVYRLGCYYSKIEGALIGVEDAGHGLTILKYLEDKEYSDIYHDSSGKTGFEITEKNTQLLVDIVRASISAGNKEPTGGITAQYLKNKKPIKLASNEDFVNELLQNDPNKRRLRAMAIAILIREPKAHFDAAKMQFEYKGRQGYSYSRRVRRK